MDKVNTSLEKKLIETLKEREAEFARLVKNGTLEKALKEYNGEKSVLEKAFKEYEAQQAVMMVSLGKSLLLRYDSNSSKEGDKIDNIKELKEKIKEKDDIIAKLKPLAKRGEQMNGQKYTAKNEKIDREILSIQEELRIEHGICQKSGLSNAIRIYSKRKKLTWHNAGNETIIHSRRVSIKRHQKTGQLPK